MNDFLTKIKSAYAKSVVWADENPGYTGFIFGVMLTGFIILWL